MWLPSFCRRVRLLEAVLVAQLHSDNSGRPVPTISSGGSWRHLRTVEVDVAPHRKRASSRRGLVQQSAAYPPIVVKADLCHSGGLPHSEVSCHQGAWVLCSLEHLESFPLTVQQQAAWNSGFRFAQDPLYWGVPRAPGETVPNLRDNSRGHGHVPEVLHLSLVHNLGQDVFPQSSCFLYLATFPRGFERHHLELDTKALQVAGEPCHELLAAIHLHTAW